MPSTFDFAVPKLPPGLYASEIWFKGTQTESGTTPARGDQPPRLPSKPPPPELPLGLPKMRPSLGCTSTQPCPANDIWTDSPEPRPMKFFSLMSVLMPVWTLEAQVIAACGSANVGASHQARGGRQRMMGGGLFNSPSRSRRRTRAGSRRSP